MWSDEDCHYLHTTFCKNVEQPLVEVKDCCILDRPTVWCRCRRCPIRWYEHCRHGRSSSFKLHDPLSTVATRLMITLFNPWCRRTTRSEVYPYHKMPSTTPVVIHFFKFSTCCVMTCLNYLSFLAITESHNFLPPAFYLSHRYRT